MSGDVNKDACVSHMVDIMRFNSGGHFEALRDVEDDWFQGVAEVIYNHAFQPSALRPILARADEDLALIADDAAEDIGTRIDSVRALLKDSMIPRVFREGRTTDTNPSDSAQTRE